MVDSLLTGTDAEYKSMYTAHRENILRFYRALKPGEDAAVEANPGYELAPIYFQLYQDERPSAKATHALAFSFQVWDYLSGVSGQVGDALSQICHDEVLVGDLDNVQETWRRIALGVRRCFARDDQLQAGLALLEDFADKTGNPATEATLLREAAFWRDRNDEESRARRNYERILEVDTQGCAWYVEYQARGYLSGWSSLDVGQAAPNFAYADIDGNLITLREQQGKLVLLDFWSTNCPGCFPEFEHLKESMAQHGEQGLAIIGASCDQDIEALRACVAKEKLMWPQICEGKDWDEPLFLRYNISSVPGTYLIDQNGTIADKGLRGEDLTKAIASRLG